MKVTKTLAIVALSGLLALNAGALAQSGTSVRFTLQGIASNAGVCDKSATFSAEIYPDKFVLNTSTAKETMPANAEGIFSKEYRAFTGSNNARFRTEGSLKTRKIRHTNLGGIQCTWEGSF